MADRILSPEEVAYRARYGQETLAGGRQQAANPRHWVQALAGALQMGLGGHYGANAAFQEKEGKASANKMMADALMSGAAPKDVAAQMMANPWAAEQGQKLALQELDPMTGLQRQKMQLMIDNARADAALNPLRRQKLEMELSIAQEARARQKALDDMIMGGGQTPPPQTPVSVPDSGAGRFAAPQMAPAKPQTLRDVLSAQPAETQAMFKAMWAAGDKAGALEMLKKQSVDDLSKQVIPGRDANGNTVLIQTSASGKAKTAELPPGVQVDFGARKGAELNAKQLTELRFSAPKAGAALRSLEQQHALVEATLDRAAPLINALSTGFGGLALKDLPTTQAQQLKTLLNTVRANIGFDALNAMRQNSPTGGALGNVTERELAFLQSVAGDLDQSQTVEQMVTTLAQIKENFRISREIRRRAYQEEFAPLYGGQMAPLPDMPKMNFGGGDAEGWQTINGVQVREKR